MQTVLVSIAGLCGVLGTAYGSVWFLDGRYASATAFDDFAYVQLKREIRDTRRLIESAQTPAVREGLEEDLESFIDLLCKSYPSDRECKQ